MTSVSAFDARTHLNVLLARVSKRETIRITLRGLPIAKLVPASEGDQGDPGELVRDIRDIRKGVILRRDPKRELIHEGHRH
jgi:prevent-host-death family protein